jgi:anti-sigma regulatory factor (Ser/Thr protein kinase)
MDGSTRSTGGTGEEEKSVNEMTLQATLDNLPEVTAFIDSQLEELDCPMKAQFQIDVAIDELFTNIATYAYGDSTGNVTVRLDTQEDPRAVLITFIDNGVPYNPLEQEEPDITLAAEDRPIGGLGIFVVKKTMDDMSYDYKDGQNILRIKKKI